MKASLLLGSLALCVACVPACETSDATQAVFDNQYPVTDAGAADSVVIYKAWWSVAELSAPVAAGAESAPLRVVKGTDYAYALLAVGWDPASGTVPTTLLPVRTSAQLTADRGDTLEIQISDATVLGNCFTGKPLAQADADFITQRIFPTEFAGQSYDATTCTLSLARDGGEAGASGAAAQ